MICCQFIFKPGRYDEDFHHLDRQIETFARALPGFVTIETWTAPEHGLVARTWTGTPTTSWLRSWPQAPDPQSLAPVTGAAFRRTARHAADVEALSRRRQ